MPDPIDPSPDPARGSPLGRLTSGHVLARNAFWVLIGQALPMALAIFTIPLLIAGMGGDRFGILTLAWLVIGYFSLFDLGLGRALTKEVAERLGSGREGEVPGVVWTSLALGLALGLAAALIAAPMTPWIVRRVLVIPAALQPEARDAFLLLTASLPFVISSAGLRGVLEAYQRFGFLNVAYAAVGAFSLVGPLIVLQFEGGLVPIIAVLLAGRVVTWGAYLGACLHGLPELRRGVVPRWSEARSLLRLGGWMTVSNTVGPIMSSLDRFLIGSLISVEAVTYYATPYEMVTKLIWVIPTAMVRVLFPAFAAGSARDRGPTRRLFRRGTKAAFLILFPLTLAIVALAHDVLTLWLGPEFARRSTRVLQYLAIGTFCNGLGMIPLVLIQALGRPDLTAKLHLIEMPLYVVALVAMTRLGGIELAALAWTLRMAADTALLFLIAHGLLTGGVAPDRRPALVAVPCLAALGLATLPMGTETRVVVLSLALAAFLPAAWFLVLSPDERALIRSPIRGLIFSKD